MDYMPQFVEYCKVSLFICLISKKLGSFDKDILDMLRYSYDDMIPRLIVDLLAARSVSNYLNKLSENENKRLRRDKIITNIMILIDLVSIILSILFDLPKIIIYVILPILAFQLIFGLVYHILSNRRYNRKMELVKRRYRDVLETLHLNQIVDF